MTYELARRPGVLPPNKGRTTHQSRTHLRDDERQHPRLLVEARARGGKAPIPHHEVYTAAVVHAHLGADLPGEVAHVRGPAQVARPILPEAEAERLLMLLLLSLLLPVVLMAVVRG